jgi:hypothetical protein
LYSKVEDAIKEMGDKQDTGDNNVPTDILKFEIANIVLVINQQYAHQYNICHYSVNVLKCFGVIKPSSVGHSQFHLKTQTPYSV